MKKFLILTLICCVQNVFSQSEEVKITPENLHNYKGEVIKEEEENQVYNTAGLEVKPEFPGGLETMNAFIKQNFKNPKDGLKGRIYATFILEKDGSLSDIKILRDLGHETGKEAIRVLKLFPKWSPGKQNNKIVRVLYSIPMVID
ncbi:energy transducer TonB [Flavobacterium hydrophilum]|uniref:TonB C-terminal domain-containing protein n=1 Tax=Flavobacterium hydrophilum TaxID=2211445 RepID=A0A2V4C6A0_9FLAO|nr:energy transducer TonB [Flavobacterium hydrophilum]PXY45633.1 hypothetical protein DMB68_00105 [Flavobacterium hydrophilum]